MATFYVENVPEELYEALRFRARQNRTPISAQVLALLEDNIPTVAELARRKELVKRIARLRSKRSISSGPFPSAEELLRQDRAR